MSMGQKNGVKRVCLKCEKTFQSEGIEWRTCQKCRQDNDEYLDAGAFGRAETLERTERKPSGATE